MQFFTQNSLHMSQMWDLAHASQPSGATASQAAAIYPRHRGLSGAGVGGKIGAGTPPQQHSASYELWFTMLEHPLVTGGPWPFAPDPQLGPQLQPEKAWIVLEDAL